MLERRRPRFSVVKLVTEILTTVATIWIVFGAMWMTSTTTGEPVTLFGYILSLLSLASP
ncbi:MAG: hypothetical protein JSV27_08945 [Candidatus Bathyarchaeota archaeon]|nr:MAG: hypothetical protein JSV27_08945 [Candidatus Bathyarchaeota archaeon]